MLMDRPTYLKTSDSIRLYESDWYEWLFRTDIDTNQKVLVPLSALYFLTSFYYSCIHEKELEVDGNSTGEIDMVAQTMKCIGYFIMGGFVWTALEYKTHRFDLHDPDSIQDNMSWDKIERHHIHHMFANQDRVIVIPIWWVTGIGAMIWIVGYYFFGVVPAGAFVSGMTLAQIFYDSMHYWFHFGGDFNFKPF
jgi:hypothetical protein